MPVGLINRPFGIFTFLTVIKRTPPILHDLDQVGDIAKQADTQGAVQVTVEDPVPAIMSQVMPLGTGGINDLIIMMVTMRGPVGNKVSIGPDVFCPH